MLTAIIFLLILTVSVVIHEFAHYLSAKQIGVPVRAFSVGMGPVLARKQWRGTEWRLSLIPLGGYVDLPGLAAEVGEDGKLHHPSEGLAKKGLWSKLFVLVAGVIANFVLAILLFAVVIRADTNFQATVAGVTPEESGTRLVSVQQGSPAETLGIEAGDVVRELNGIPNPTRDEVIETVRNADELRLVLERNGDTLTVETPWPPEDAADSPMLGVGLEPERVVFPDMPPISFVEAIPRATGFLLRLIPETISGIVRGIGQTLGGQRSEEIVGPVGMVNLVGEAARGGLIPVLFFAGIINFSLAIFNLLPIPGLDGGRMLLSTIIALRGKPFKPGQEEFVHFLGIVAIMALVVIITFGELRELLGFG